MILCRAIQNTHYVFMPIVTFIMMDRLLIIMYMVKIKMCAQ